MDSKESLIFFKLKRDILKDQEIQLAEEELRALLPPEQEEKLKRLATTGKIILLLSKFDIQNELILEIITRNTYLGSIKGFYLIDEGFPLNMLIQRLTYFYEILIFFNIKVDEDVVLNSFKIERATLKIVDIIESYLTNEKSRKKLEFSLKKGCRNVETEELLSSDLVNPSTRLFVDEEIKLLRIIPDSVFLETSLEVLKMWGSYISGGRKHDLQSKLEAKENELLFYLIQSIIHLHAVFNYVPNIGQGKTYMGDFLDWHYRRGKNHLTHDFHFFKAKAFPRMGRALQNVLKVTQDQVLLDPFVGSGTFLIDASSLGVQVHGIDHVPLFVDISLLKTDFTVKTSNLRITLIKLLQELDNYREKRDSQIINLCKLHDQEEISIEIIQEVINAIIEDSGEKSIQGSEWVKLFFKISLSEAINHLQRKKAKNLINQLEKVLIKNYSTLFLYENVMRFLKRTPNVKKPRIICEDLIEIKSEKLPVFDFIISSPPYLNTVDYLNMVKNSIFHLYPEFNEKSFKKLQNSSIGWKHNTLKHEELTKSLENLPERISNFLKKISKIDLERGILTFHYYNDLKSIFLKLKTKMRKSGIICLVVSNVHLWKIKKEEFFIPNAEFIRLILTSIGYTHLKLKKVEVDLQKSSNMDYRKTFTENILFFQNS